MPTRRRAFDATESGCRMNAMSAGCGARRGPRPPLRPCAAAPVLTDPAMRPIPWEGRRRHYRLLTSGVEGTSEGADRSFTTAPAPGSPSSPAPRTRKSPTRSPPERARRAGPRRLASRLPVAAWRRPGAPRGADPRPPKASGSSARALRCREPVVRSSRDADARRARRRLRLALLLLLLLRRSEGEAERVGALGRPDADRRCRLRRDALPRPQQCEAL